ncbi:MAG: LD-carboxypeptidase [Gemmatimonadaceae bacterium]|nr:LD-carboxypeptidase [Gemmatimonadaceae bacterium]
MLGDALIPLAVPPRLQTGARIALVSPSGPLRDVADLVQAEANVRLFGWEPVIGAHAMSRDGYFAGTDAQRRMDLLAAIEDDTIDAIWCVRGGYGAARLLPFIDVDAIARRPKVLIGYSDITALHAVWQRAGVVSYHGPVARAAFTPFSLDSFRRAIVLRENSAGPAPAAEVLRPGRASGRLAGGNLALLASLCGTPWAVHFRGAIAIIEDVGEATYRLDRMLNQLLQAGAFDGCVALAFGQFADCPDDTGDGRRSLRDVARDVADHLNVPALFGIPCGHVPDQWTFPFGAIATLDTSAGTLLVHSEST